MIKNIIWKDIVGLNNMEEKLVKAIDKLIDIRIKEHLEKEQNLQKVIIKNQVGILRRLKELEDGKSK